MDISTWTDSEIAQLPDHFFGERKYIQCLVWGSGGVLQWKMSDVAFPAKSMIWEVSVHYILFNSSGDYIRVALGTVLPTNQAEMTALERLLPYWGRFNDPLWEIHSYYYTNSIRLPMREIKDTDSNKLIVEARTTASGYCYAQVNVLYSEVPTEIPQWLI